MRVSLRDVVPHIVLRNRNVSNWVPKRLQSKLQPFVQPLVFVKILKFCVDHGELWAERQDPENHVDKEDLYIFEAWIHKLYQMAKSMEYSQKRQNSHESRLKQQVLHNHQSDEKVGQMVVVIFLTQIVLM